MTGAFVDSVAKGAYDDAIKDLSSDGLSCLFEEQGVPKNQTDAAWAEWVSDMIASPVVKTLRGTDISSDGLFCALAVAVGLDGAATKHLTDSRFSGVRETLSGLATVLKVATNGGPCADAMPSAVRAALKCLTELQSKCPVYLALHHGVLGVHVLNAAQAAVKQSKNDEIATNQFRKVRGQVQMLVEGSHGEDGCKLYAQEVSNLSTCLPMWSKAALEDNHGDFIDACEKLNEVWESGRGGFGKGGFWCPNAKDKKQKSATKVFLKARISTKIAVSRTIV